MSYQPIPMDPKYIIDLVIKRRWILLVPFALAMVVGIYLSITLPKIYEASTTILIQPQRVPQNFVQSIVTSDPGDRINTLSQQILSRTNLNKIIQDLKLFQSEEFKGVYLEDKINNLRGRIDVNVIRDRHGTDAFSISVTGKNPEKITTIANTLASYFIDENLRVREAQAVGTSDFLDDELENMRERLEEVEGRLKKYRETFMGELPGQLQSNLRILDRLQDQLSERQHGISEAKIRLAALQNEIAESRSQAIPSVPDETQGEISNIHQLQLQLENLQNRYTDRHPDIIRLKKRIKEMKEKEANEEPFSAIGGSENAASDQQESIPRAFRAQYIEIVNEIRRLESDLPGIESEIQLYQKRVENTPKREQELLGLRRDYQNIQATYESLLERKLEAEISVNMERKQKGEQFRILDPAHKPHKPIRPDMRKLVIMIVGAGLGIGGGIIFLLEFLSNSFKRPQDIEGELDLPVLCSVPQITDSKTRMMKRLEYVLCGIFGIISITLFGGFVLLSQKGVEPTIELVRKVVDI